MLVTKYDFKDNIEKRIHWALAQMVAQDTERLLEVHYGEGRTRSGSGSNYSIVQKNENKSIRRVHRFKARGDVAAIEHVKKFLEKNWND